MAGILVLIVGASILLRAEPTLSRTVQLRFNFDAGA
jgi:hypothetical protein